MGKSKKMMDKGGEWLEKRAVAIWTNLQTNHLWQRILKNTLATTIAVILALIPAVVERLGRAAYLAPMTTVFGHPGRRFGMMAEALILAVSGTLLGVAWSTFGVFLSSLVYNANPPAAYTIRGLFLVVAVFVHGFLRSHTPRLFIFVLLMIIVAVVSLTSTATEVTTTSVTQLVYPVLLAAGILLLVNTLVFPEFSSSFLGITTIETLGETVRALRDAGKYFINTAEIAGRMEDSSEQETEEENELTQAPTLAEKPPKKKEDDKPLMERILSKFQKAKIDEPKLGKEKGGDSVAKTVKLKSLTDSKAKLRSKLASCKAAQTECNFELAYAVLPPRDLKPISDTSMKALVANTIALIGSCESKYALMGDEHDNKEVNQPQLQRPTEELYGESGDESSRPVTRGEESNDESTDDKREAKEKEKRKRKKKKDKRPSLESEREDLELVKPRKEIEFGDVELLKYLVNRIAKPLADLQEKIDRSVDVVTSCLAYCYDVPKLPSGTRPPTGIELQEIDIRVDILSEAMAEFDRDSASALEGAAALHNLETPGVDIMPRMETFLISSFLLNLRQAALHTLEMLRHSRIIVEKRQARHERRRLWAPKIKWKKWLMSGGEEDSLALPSTARKDARTGTMREDANEDNSTTNSKDDLISKKDIETGTPKTSRSPKPVSRRRYVAKPKAEEGDLLHRLRNGLADFLEYLSTSEDVLYALKMAIAVLLVTWPAFLHQWNTWYSLNRGVWAALQLVLITEVAIGTSVSVFILRAVGTTLGCVWGYAAYEAGNGNRIVIVAMLVIGIIPSAYIQLGSKYIKAGMVSIVSMCIVALATADGTIPGSATENFLKRLIAFLIGGVVALGVELVLFPVKARDRLVESLASSLLQISEMESCLAYGIEAETNLSASSLIVSARFSRAKAKAEGALSAAETFLPFCDNEPRLKGSFAGLALIYAEILYVLHAIVDKMDNMLHLRHEYGSGVLEELNTQVFSYRRNVAGSITLILFAVHSALLTKLPLPQFLPSARLAHLRMINRVRSVILDSHSEPPKHKNHTHAHTHSEIDIEQTILKRLVRQKYLSWNAASAGQVEVIEYLEELIDLTKLLVGANEFRSGLLTRPTYREYIDRVQPLANENLHHKLAHEHEHEHEHEEEDNDEEEERDTMPEIRSKPTHSPSPPSPPPPPTSPSPASSTPTPIRKRSTFRIGSGSGSGGGSGSGSGEGGSKTKTTTDNTSSTPEAIEREREMDIPRSLQRVRTRRMSWVAEESARSMGAGGVGVSKNKNRSREKQREKEGAGAGKKTT